MENNPVLPAVFGIIKIKPAVHEFHRVLLDNIIERFKISMRDFIPEFSQITCSQAFFFLVQTVINELNQFVIQLTFVFFFKK